MSKVVKCPKCGGQLVYETFGQYGHMHKINKDGRIQTRYKSIDYGGDDVMTAMVYCTSCGFDITGQCESDGAMVKVKMNGDAEDD